MTGGVIGTRLDSSAGKCPRDGHFPPPRFPCSYFLAKISQINIPSRSSFICTEVMNVLIEIAFDKVFIQ